MKFGQLIEHNLRNIFFKNHAGNDAGKLDIYFYLYYKNALDKVKASCRHFCFEILWWTLTWTYNKNKFTWYFRLLIQRYAQFLSFINGLGLASPPHFQYVFQENVSCYILLNAQILFSVSLYFLRYWSIFVFSLFSLFVFHYVTSFEISKLSLGILSRHFSTWSQK